MTAFTPDTLWELLPSIHRVRDAERAVDGETGPLRALVEVLGEQARILERDIDQLYDDWFIETAAEWVVPYIGDLLAVRSLYDVGTDVAFSQRSRVANTLAYRRRKGTTTMLEQLARDTTGWPARAVEFFELTATSQHVNHVRLHAERTVDLRDANRLELVDTAFDTTLHTADVRRIRPDRGHHNLPNMGLLLWRLDDDFLPRVEARAVAEPPDGRYHLHPYGLDVPLANRPRTETEITHLAEEPNVPGLLRRRPLHDELVARRDAWTAGDDPPPGWFEEPAAFEVALDGAPLVPEQVLVCDLSDWDDAGWTPPATTVLTNSGGSLDTRVAVDPVTGRLAVLAGADPADVVEVSHATLVPGDVGGGHYDRATAARIVDRTVHWQVTVGRDDADFATITDALTSNDPTTPGWNEQPDGTVGVIVLIDNATLTENLTGTGRIAVGAGSLLVIVAATVAASSGEIVAVERRCHLLGDVEILGTAADEDRAPGGLVLDGLLVEGAITVLDGHLGALTVAHSTLGLQDPDAPVGITVEDGPRANRELRMELDHVVSGPIEAPTHIRRVRLADTVLHGRPDGTGRAGAALSGNSDDPGPEAEVERCTLFGGVHVQSLALGSETIFTESVEVDRLQEGCVRFSWVPPGSRTPRRHRCQPALALRERADELGLASVDVLPPAEQWRIVRRITPAFTASRYGEPAHAQLTRSTATEILTGAEDGSEMGVWSRLRHPQRISNLESSLDEYLRFGLEAGLIFVT